MPTGWSCGVHQSENRIIISISKNVPSGDELVVAPQRGWRGLGLFVVSLRATLTLTAHTTILSLLTVAMQWLGNVGCSLMYKLCLLSFVSSTSFTTPPLWVFLFDITVYLWDCRTLWGWTEQAMYRSSVWLANVHLNLWITRRALWLLCLDWESVQLKIEEWWKSGVTCFFQPHRNTKSRTLRKGGGILR